jgi:hypothetical protein
MPGFFGDNAGILNDLAGQILQRRRPGAEAQAWSPRRALSMRVEMPSI